MYPTPQKAPSSGHMHCFTKKNEVPQARRGHQGSLVSLPESVITHPPLLKYKYTSWHTVSLTEELERGEEQGVFPQASQGVSRLEE